METVKKFGILWEVRDPDLGLAVRSALLAPESPWQERAHPNPWLQVLDPAALAQGVPPRPGVGRLLVGWREDPEWGAALETWRGELLGLPASPREIALRLNALWRWQGRELEIQDRILEGVEAMLGLLRMPLGQSEDEALLSSLGLLERLTRSERSALLYHPNDQATPRLLSHDAVPQTKELPPLWETLVWHQALTDQKRQHGFTADGNHLLVIPLLRDGDPVLVVAMARGHHSYTEVEQRAAYLLSLEIRSFLLRRRDQRQLVRLSLAIEQSPKSVLITDQEVKIEYVNPAFLKMTGYALHEVLGRNPRMLRSGRTPASTYQEMWTALNAGQVWRGEVLNRRKDGQEYREALMISPIRDSRQQVVGHLAIKEDITERQRLIRELQVYRHHLETLVQERTRQLAQARQRAERENAEKTRLIADLSHEIRTPLHAMVGLSHLLQQASAASEQGPLLAMIDGSARHLLTIVGQVLEQTENDSGGLLPESEPFLASNPLYEVRDLLQPQAVAKQLSLQVEPAPDLCWLLGDPVRVRQILLIFASNALKFTKRGEVILRSVLEQERDDGVRLRYEVADTGAGLDPQQLQSFLHAEASDQTVLVRHDGGPALGIPVARQLAQGMGAEIGGESEPGQGSRFFLRLDLPKGQAPSQDPQAQAQLRHRGARILVVEDDPVSGEVVCGLLREAGWEPDLASNGQSALERFHQQSYHLVLMDIGMPLLDGLQTTRALRTLQSGERLPVIALTANAFESDRRACFESGMNDFLTKPVHPQRLFETVSRWLDHTGSGPPSANDPSVLSAPPPPSSPRTRAVLREEQGLTLLAGDRGKYRELLTSFLQQRRAEVSQLARREPSSQASVAHGIKGAAATLGAERVAEHAAHLEALARQGQPTEEALAALDRSLAELAVHLRMVPEELVAEPLAPQDPGDVAAILDDAIRLLQRGDPQAISLLQSQQAALESVYGSAAQEAVDLASRFEFEQARAQLQRLSRPE